MPRAILGIVVSYIAIMIFFFALYRAILMLAAERVFQPDTFKVSPLWIALALAGGFCAGALAGYLCLTISGRILTCQVLAAIVFLLSVEMCFPSVTADQTPRPRNGELSVMEAMKQGQAPIWRHLLSAVLNGAGVFVGAPMKRTSLPR